MAEWRGAEWRGMKAGVQRAGCFDATAPAGLHDGRNGKPELIADCLCFPLRNEEITAAESLYRLEIVIRNVVCDFVTQHESLNHRVMVVESYIDAGIFD